MLTAFWEQGTPNNKWTQGILKEFCHRHHIKRVTDKWHILPALCVLLVVLLAAEKNP
jgi:hypothetical protein